MCQMLYQVEVHRRGLEAMRCDMVPYSSFAIEGRSIRLDMILFNEKEQLEWKVIDFFAELEKE